jgi:hypothetical protein
MSFKRLMVLGVLMGISLQTLGSMRRMVPAGAKMGASALSATGFRNVSSGGNVPTMSLDEAYGTLGVKPRTDTGYWYDYAYRASQEFVKKFNEQPEDQKMLIEALNTILKGEAGGIRTTFEQWSLFFQDRIQGILNMGRYEEDDKALAKNNPKAFVRSVSDQISKLDNMYKTVQKIYPDIHLYGVDISNCSREVIGVDNNSLIKDLVEREFVALPKSLVNIINGGRNDIFEFLINNYKDKIKPDIQDLVAMFKTGRFETYYKGMLDKAGIDYKKIILDFMAETQSLRFTSFEKWRENALVIKDLYDALILKDPKLALELAVVV